MNPELILRLALISLGLVFLILSFAGAILELARRADRREAVGGVNPLEGITKLVEALKALFDNLDESLWPGQFVDVELQLAIESAALTVPAAAVVTGQAGTFVYVVDEAGKAQKHPVTVRRTVEGLAVVEGDLTPGQTVITDGQIRVVPGGAVQAKGAAPAQPAGQPQGGGK